jgi:hypothetical protein
MISVPLTKSISFSDRQTMAINQFYSQEKEKNADISFETAFSNWLSSGYAEKFRFYFTYDENLLN